MFIELKSLLMLYKKEIKSYLNFDLNNYLKVLFFSKSKIIFIKVLYFIFFIFIFRLIWDILKILFHFYYITLNWFFNCLKFIINFYINEDFWIKIYVSIINFIRYFILFIPFVRINEIIKKRKINLYVYIVEKIIERMIRIIWWRPRIRRKLGKLVYGLQFPIIFFVLVPYKFLSSYILTPIIYIIEAIFRHFQKWIFFFWILYQTWQFNKIAGVDYLRSGSSLIHIAVMLQKHGFEAPVHTDAVDRFKARLAYWEYKKNYKYSELTPDKMNGKTIDIYIFLLDLFSGTRYEIKRVPLTAFFFIFFPYEILYNIFYFFYYLYVILMYIICYIFFSPLILISIIFSVIFEYIRVIDLIIYLLFRDLDYLAKLKDKIWEKIRENAKKVEEKELKRKKYDEFLEKIKKNIKKK